MHNNTVPMHALHWSKGPVPQLCLLFAFLIFPFPSLHLTSWFPSPTQK